MCSDAYLVTFTEIETFLQIEQERGVLRIPEGRMEVHIEKIDADLEIVA